MRRKKRKKMADGKCFFCPESATCTLHTHRIKPGSEGGSYCAVNELTVCANCHAKSHAGEIIIDRRYFSTKGWVLHFWKKIQDPASPGVFTFQEFYEPCGF